jgi:predicted RNA binding protein YcfA (HicA-like mRNA interferase family)
MRFNELARLLEQNGFRLIKENGSAREIPTGTCNAIMKAAGLKENRENRD